MKDHRTPLDQQTTTQLLALLEDHRNDIARIKEILSGRGVQGHIPGTKPRRNPT